MSSHSSERTTTRERPSEDELHLSADDLREEGYEFALVPAPSRGIFHLPSEGTDSDADADGDGEELEPVCATTGSYQTRDLTFAVRMGRCCINCYTGGNATDYSNEPATTDGERGSTGDFSYYQRAREIGREYAAETETQTDE